MHVLLLLLVLATLGPAAALASEPRPIQDNSFLVEEAYNQEAGVVQHIGTFSRSAAGTWCSSFTEEWPVMGQAHQASVTVNYAQVALGVRGVGDAALNYRWQALGDGDAPLAFSPRVSLVVPAGDPRRGLGAGALGVQVNLPASVALGNRFVTHLNAGGTVIPSARRADGSAGDLASLTVGQSVVWLAHPRLNLLVEALYTLTEQRTRAGAERTQALTVVPGVRFALELPGDLEVVPGVGVPIGVGPSAGERALFLYVSFEHPLRAAGASGR